MATFELDDGTSINLPGSTAAPQRPRQTFGEAFGTGVDYLKQSFGETIAGIGKGMNLPSVEKAGIGISDRAALDAYLKRPTVQGIEDVQNIGDFGELLQSAVVSNAPTLAALALTRGAGRGIAGRMGAGAAAKDAAGIAGMVAGDLPLQFGEGSRELREAGVDNWAGGAFAAAIPRTLLDVAPTEMLFKRFGAKAGGSMLANAGRVAGTQALAEGATEAAQEGIGVYTRSQLDEAYDPAGPEAFSRMFNAFVLGGLTGAAFGGVAGLFGKPGAPTGEAGTTPTGTEPAAPAPAGPDDGDILNFVNQQLGLNLEGGKDNRTQKQANKDAATQRDTMSPPFTFDEKGRVVETDLSAQQEESDGQTSLGLTGGAAAPVQRDLFGNPSREQPEQASAPTVEQAVSDFQRPIGLSTEIDAQQQRKADEQQFQDDLAKPLGIKGGESKTAPAEKKRAVPKSEVELFERLASTLPKPPTADAPADTNPPLVREDIDLPDLSDWDLASPLSQLLPLEQAKELSALPRTADMLGVDTSRQALTDQKQRFVDRAQQLKADPQSYVNQSDPLTDMNGLQFEDTVFFRDDAYTVPYKVYAVRDNTLFLIDPEAIVNEKGEKAHAVFGISADKVPMLNKKRGGPSDEMRASVAAVEQQIQGIEGQIDLIRGTGQQVARAEEIAQLRAQADELASLVKPVRNIVRSQEAESFRLTSQETAVAPDEIISLVNNENEGDPVAPDAPLDAGPVSRQQSLNLDGAPQRPPEAQPDYGYVGETFEEQQFRLLREVATGRRRSVVTGQIEVVTEEGTTRGRQLTPVVLTKGQVGTLSAVWDHANMTPRQLQQQATAYTEQMTTTTYELVVVDIDVGGVPEIPGQRGRTAQVRSEVSGEKAKLIRSFKTKAEADAAKKLEQKENPLDKKKHGAEYKVVPVSVSNEKTTEMMGLIDLIRKEQQFRKLAEQKKSYDTYRKLRSPQRSDFESDKEYEAALGRSKLLADRMQGVSDNQLKRDITMYRTLLARRPDSPELVALKRRANAAAKELHYRATRGQLTIPFSDMVISVSAFNEADRFNIAHSSLKSLREVVMEYRAVAAQAKKDLYPQGHKFAGFIKPQYADKLLRLYDQADELVRFTLSGGSESKNVRLTDADLKLLRRAEIMRDQANKVPKGKQRDKLLAKAQEVFDKVNQKATRGIPVDIPDIVNLKMLEEIGVDSEAIRRAREVLKQRSETRGRTKVVSQVPAADRTTLQLRNNPLWSQHLSVKRNIHSGTVAPSQKTVPGIFDAEQVALSLSTESEISAYVAARKKAGADLNSLMKTATKNIPATNVQAGKLIRLMASMDDAQLTDMSREVSTKSAIAFARLNGFGEQKASDAARQLAGFMRKQAALELFARKQLGMTKGSVESLKGSGKGGAPVDRFSTSAESAATDKAMRDTERKAAEYRLQRDGLLDTTVSGIPVSSVLGKNTSELVELHQMPVSNLLKAFRMGAKFAALRNAFQKDNQAKQVQAADVAKELRSLIGKELDYREWLAGQEAQQVAQAQLQLTEPVREVTDPELVTYQKLKEKKLAANDAAFSKYIANNSPEGLAAIINTANSLFKTYTAARARGEVPMMAGGRLTDKVVKAHVKMAEFAQKELTLRRLDPRLNAQAMSQASVLARRQQSAGVANTTSAQRAQRDAESRSSNALGASIVNEALREESPATRESLERLQRKMRGEEVEAAAREPVAAPAQIISEVTAETLAAQRAERAAEVAAEGAPIISEALEGFSASTRPRNKMTQGGVIDREIVDAIDKLDAAKKDMAKRNRTKKSFYGGNERMYFSARALIEEIARLVGRSTRVAVAPKLGFDTDGNEVFGNADTIANMIMVAMNAKNGWSVAGHEAFHIAEDRLMDNYERKIVAEAFRKGSKLRQQVDQLLMAQGEVDAAESLRMNDAEARAYGFQLWRDGQLQTRGTVERIFKKILAFFERVANLARGRGFRNWEDVFTAFQAGEFANRDSSLKQPGGLRFSNSSGSHPASTLAANEAAFNPIFGATKPSDYANIRGIPKLRSGDLFGWLRDAWNKTVGSFSNLAKTSPGARAVYKLVSQMERRVHEIMFDNSAIITNWLDGTPEQIQRVGDVLRKGDHDGKVFGDESAELRRLTPAEREMYKSARQMIDNLLLTKAASEVALYTRHKATDAAQQAQANAERLVREGYVPRYRYGGFVVFVTSKSDPGAKFGYSAFDSAAQAQSFADNLTQQMSTQPFAGDMDIQVYKGETTRLMQPGLDVSQFLDHIDRYSVQLTPEARKNMVSSLAKTAESARNFQHREDIEGESKDIMRVMHDYMFGTSHAIGSIEYTKSINDAHYKHKWRDEGPDGLQSKAMTADMLNYVRSLGAAEHGSETVAQWRAAASLFMLGGNISGALVQLSQTPMATIPYLSKFTGMVDANAVTYKAMGEVAGRMFGNPMSLKRAVNSKSGMGKLSADEVNLLYEANRSGITQAQYIFAAMGIAKGQFLSKSKLGRTLEKGWMSPFVYSEEVNRRTALIAAYRIGKQTLAKGGQLLDSETGERFTDAGEFARYIVNETQFDYSKANRPKWARTDIGAILLTFKSFPLFMVQMLAHMDAKQRTIALGTLVLMGGLQGLPFADDLDDLLDTLSQRTGVGSGNMRKSKEEAVAALLGHVGLANEADYFMRGFVGEIFNIDLSSRIGLGDIIPGTDVATYGGDYGKFLEELAGPVGSLARGGFKAAGELASGDIGGALKSVPIVGIRNAAIGVEAGFEGEFTNIKNERIAPASVGEALLKSIGLTTSDVQREHRMANLARISANYITGARREVMSNMVEAERRGDREKVRELDEWVSSWNKSHPRPELQMNISVADRRRAVKEAGKTTGERGLASLNETQRSGFNQFLTLE